MAVTRDARIGGERRWTVYATSLAGLVHWLKTTETTWQCKSSQEEERGYSWDLNAGWQGALELAEKGWSEGVGQLAGVAAQLPATERIAKEKLCVAGYMPDVGRFLQGEPQHMRRKGGSIAHRPVVSLVVGTGGTANVTAQQMMNYGRAILAIIDQIEATGRRVEVTAVWTSRGVSDARATVSWTVKAAEDPVDLSALAFSLAHPAAMRRLGFAAYERSSLRTSYGYGATTNAQPDDLLHNEDEALFLPGLTTSGSRANTYEQALELAVEQINRAHGEELVSIAP